VDQSLGSPRRSQAVTQFELSYNDAQTLHNIAQHGLVWLKGVQQQVPGALQAHQGTGGQQQQC
jgi:hypothetical protein